jgi:RNA polymerase sigma-70 factor (ECF subfamily)
MTSFHDLYLSYSTDVYRFVYWLSGSSEEAEDVTSETFLRAFTAGDVRAETVKAYLLTIARNLYLQRLRRDRRRGELEVEPVDPAPGPERLAEGRLELKATLRQLRALPEPTRAALLLHVEEGVTYAEISRALGISVGAVKVRVHRARTLLAAAREGKERST